MTGETMLRVLAHRCMQDTDENKLVYTTVFEQYVNIVEHTIDERLQEAVPGFSMQDFSSLLAKHEEQLSADVFDLLLSLGDFEVFKVRPCASLHVRAFGPHACIGCFYISNCRSAVERMLARGATESEAHGFPANTRLGLNLQPCMPSATRPGATWGARCAVCNGLPRPARAACRS